MKDLFADCFRGFYAGERFVRENSAEYRFLRALALRALGLAKMAGVKKAEDTDFKETVFTILDSIILKPEYDPNNTVLNLKE